MIYTVLKNNGWGGFHDEGEFDTLRKARAYCKAKTKGKEKVEGTKQSGRSVFWFEIYKGEVEIDGEDAYPIETTDEYYV